MKRHLVGLALGLAALAAGAAAAWAAFTTEQLTPQTVAATTWVTTTTTPSPSGQLAVQESRPNVQQGGNPEIPITFTLVNRGSTAVSLSNVTIRYWFTAEQTAMSVQCYYAPNPPLPSGCGNVTESIGTVAPALPGADRYLLIGFTSGTLAANGGSVSGMNAAVRANATPYFDLTNDWSYRGLTTANPAADAPCITAYISGTLVWGQAPSTSPTAPCT